MKINVGYTDRIFRFVLGLALLAILFFVENNFRYVGLIGVILIVTAFTRRCPVYSLFGISSCRLEKHS